LIYYSLQVHLNVLLSGNHLIALLQYNEIFYVALMQVLIIDLSILASYQLNQKPDSESLI
jgi:hypothetical protein